MSTISSQEIISIIKGEIEDYDAHAGQINETGSVIWVGDGIAIVYGLFTPCTERSLYLKTVSRVWSRTSVKMKIGCILFGKDTGIHRRDKGYRTKKKSRSSGRKALF